MSERTDLPIRLRQEVAREPETQRLLWEAAAEIERLRKIIDDYVGITQASSREIKALRAGARC